MTICVTLQPNLLKFYAFTLEQLKPQYLKAKQQLGDSAKFTIKRNSGGLWCMSITKKGMPSS